MTNTSEHFHICKADRYKPHEFKCWKPECESLMSGICDVCMYRAHITHKGAAAKPRKAEKKEVD